MNILSIIFLNATLLSASAWAPAGENIKTRWASEVSPENARTEYPRPQMVRKDWQCLNGLWDYAITPKDEQTMPQAEGQILVPFCIESSLSGIAKRVGEENALWYKTSIQKPEKWSGKKILLHFDAVDWFAKVYVNGKLSKIHSGGYTAFELDITDAFSAGPAEIVVKVWDPTDNTEYSIPRGKQVSSPSGIWYTPVTGIWQSVWMEAVPEAAHIADYNVVTDIATGEICVETKCEGIREGDKIRVDVLRPRIGYSAEKPGCNLFRKGRATVPANEAAKIKVRRPKLWSPDKPYLYGLKISILRDGKVIDKVNGYTAMRKISVQRDEAGVKRLALNDKILFQFGPLDQGWWPDGLYTAPTAEAMVWDIEATKELGFNMIRKHIKIEPAGWYYGCDKLGIMVWQDMPSIGRYKDRSDWGQGEDYYGSGKDYWAQTPENKENYYKEWYEIMGQLKKFQSIVVWVPFNEAWGQFDTEKVCEFTKSLDSTRLINAASGGNWIKGAGDILDSHTYPHPEMRILDTAMVNVLGEYGGIGRPIEGHTWDIGRKWGYVQYDSEEKVTDCYCMFTKGLVGIKQLDYCAAAVYTQTTDVEGEVNGFYTYDREILKMNSERIKKANQEVINAANTTELPLAKPSAFHYPYKDGNKTKHLELFTLRNGDLILQVTNFGARVISLLTPDKDGKLDDVVVGYNDAERFVNNTGERFFGAIVGRVANRIGGARFTLDGKTYNLPKNDNCNTLHGGLIGVDMAVWSVKEQNDSSILFAYTAPDGQDGFPGNLSIELRYSLTADNSLDIQYKATTDKATPVNLSNHAFFNLHGSKCGTILDHELTVDADAIVPVDKTLIPTGELMLVEGSAFDFRKKHVIGERINDDHQQLKFGNGYDHCWVLNAPADGKVHKACTLHDPVSGRSMDVLTDQPGMQFYAGNFFDGSYCGKVPGMPIEFRGALAIEVQKWPDAVNHKNFPDTILRPGEEYTQHSVYKFY